MTRRPKRSRVNNFPVEHLEGVYYIGRDHQPVLAEGRYQTGR